MEPVGPDTTLEIVIKGAVMFATILTAGLLVGSQLLKTAAEDLKKIRARKGALVVGMIIFGFLSPTARADHGDDRLLSEQPIIDISKPVMGNKETIFKDLCTTRLVHCEYTFIPNGPGGDGVWGSDDGFEPLGGACSGELSANVLRQVPAFKNKFENAASVKVSDIWPNGYQTILWIDSATKAIFSCTQGYGLILYFRQTLWVN